jgi:hypothetical protein
MDWSIGKATRLGKPCPRRGVDPTAISRHSARVPCNRGEIHAYLSVPVGGGCADGPAVRGHGALQPAAHGIHHAGADHGRAANAGPDAAFRRRVILPAFGQSIVPNDKGRHGGPCCFYEGWVKG